MIQCVTFNGIAIFYQNLLFSLLFYFIQKIPIRLLVYCYKFKKSKLNKRSNFLLQDDGIKLRYKSNEITILLSLFENDKIPKVVTLLIQENITI